jgi:hypothetical protein
VYLGVGPEQNFTYIAAIRPRLAFVTDIGRGNLHLHLLYKALFELSVSRADFVSRLFSRPRPAGLTETTPVVELMNAYMRAGAGSESAFAANVKAVSTHLTKTRALPLDDDDLTGIEYVYRNFLRFGPAIDYTSSIGRPGTGITYAALMSAIDPSTRTSRTYLSSEERFAFVKSMQAKNLIVPIVGNSPVPKRCARWVSICAIGAVVSAFYVSNVEMYLQRNRVWEKFCANVATLPLDADSIFIRPDNRRAGAFSPMAAETAGCR